MKIIHLNNDNFKEAVSQKGKKVVVDFWAEWCNPCRMFGPIFEKTAENYQDENVVFCKANVDEAKDAAMEFDVMSIPTVALFQDGKVIRQKVGVMNEKALHDFIQE